MITREGLDAALPDTPQVWKLASRLAFQGDKLDQANILPAGLRWLAEFTEGDRFSHAPEGWDWGDTWWNIEIDGLNYKSRSHYLTAEGWPLQTTCWYVRVECGWREFVAAEIPELAVVRALIVVALAAKRRLITSKDRLPILEMAKVALSENPTG